MYFVLSMTNGVTLGLDFALITTIGVVVGLSIATTKRLVFGLMLIRQIPRHFVFDGANSIVIDRKDNTYGFEN